MKLEPACAWRNVLKLFRFLVLYSGGVALLFFLMPKGALLLQAQYENLSGPMKFGTLAVFILAIVIRQLVRRRRTVEKTVETPFPQLSSLRARSAHSS